MQMYHEGRRVWTVTEIATEAGIHRQNITRWGKDGLVPLPTVKFGRRAFYTEEEAREVLNFAGQWSPWNREAIIIGGN